MACTSRSRWDIKEVVEAVFFTTSYKKVYDGDIMLVLSTDKHEFMDLNGPSKIQPATYRRAPGRPKKKRIRSRGESKGRQYICGRCGEYGNHYWTTCLDAIEDESGEESE